MTRTPGATSFESIVATARTILADIADADQLQKHIAQKMMDLDRQTERLAAAEAQIRNLTGEVNDDISIPELTDLSETTSKAAASLNAKLLQKREAAIQSSICGLCLKAQREIIYLDCGHLFTCKDCANLWEEKCRCVASFKSPRDLIGLVTANAIIFGRSLLRTVNDILKPG